MANSSSPLAIILGLKYITPTRMILASLYSQLKLSTWLVTIILQALPHGCMNPFVSSVSHYWWSLDHILKLTPWGDSFWSGSLALRIKCFVLHPRQLRVVIDLHCKNLPAWTRRLSVAIPWAPPTWPNPFRSEEFHVKSGMSYVSVVFLFIMTI